MAIDPLRALLLSPLLALFTSACTTETPNTVVESVEARIPLLETRRANFHRIAQLEDRRTDGGLELQRLALSADVETRARAMRALGRLPFPDNGEDVTRALLRGLEDSEAKVRATAAFGLGQRVDPASIEGLLAAWKDGDEVVRARMVEAGSRFDDRTLREEVMYSLSDPSALVRAEAATAPHRWDPSIPGAGVVDSALANLAAKAPSKLRQERWGLPPEEAGGLEPEDGEVVWRALFSLARRKSERGREVFYLWCRAQDNVEARIFATRGLGALEEITAATREALRECLEDQDWRVCAEAAIGLGRFPQAASLPALERALNNPNAHVRAAVARSMGSYQNERLLVRPILEGCLVDLSPNVKGAAIRALSELLGAQVAADLEARALDREPMIRKAVADSCQYLPPNAALPLLNRLSRDEDSAVAYTATQGMGAFLDDEGARDRVHELLGSSDNGLRLGAVLALQTNPLRQDLGPLMRCYRSSEGDISDEIKAEILRAAAKLDDDRAFEILHEGLRSKRIFNRKLAAELMAERFPNSRFDEGAALPPQGGELPRINMIGSNPRVEVRTTRGTLVFELYLDVAPIHVHNFLTLARQGEYDGLRFHRVVADFVIQGADYRGDGNGGMPWNGDSLRHEFNEMKYVEGSLGMPRNADPDSGGSQFFVTHRPTPHLDGKYTLFGQLSQGFEVLRAVEEGDKILKVSVRGE